MKTKEKQLYKSDDKIISLLEKDDKLYIVKQFFNHENRGIYLQLMRHPHYNICPIYNVKQENGRFTVTEAYLGSETILDVAKRYTSDQIYLLIYEILNALSHLHQLKIVHRDLKPDNIYFYEGRVLVNDFDISKAIMDNQKKDTQVLGTVGYASPEQCGFLASDHRTDIYSLGIIIKVMFESALDYRGTLSDTQTRVIERCTKMSPEERYQSTEEIRKDLKRASITRSRYTLPGFRTRNVTPKVFAGLGYFVMISMILLLETEGSTSIIQDIQSKILGGSMIILTWLVATNYLDIRDLLPVKLRRIKILGPFLLWCALFIAVVIVYVLIEALLSSML